MAALAYGLGAWPNNRKEGKKELERITGKPLTGLFQLPIILSHVVNRNNKLLMETDTWPVEKSNDDVAQPNSEQ